MAYVEVLGLNPGDTVNDAIDTYLNLKLQGLTYDYTVVDVNGTPYPIGFFDDNTIELFELGVTTINNINFIVGKGGQEFDDEYKKHTNYFIDQLFEKYDQKYKIDSILDAFSEVAEKSNHELLDQEQKDSIKARLEEENNKAK